MNVRIFWVRAMKCMCAQTRPRFILSYERVFGGMEFEPMLTPREKSPLPENFPKGGSNPRRCGQRAQTLPTSYSGPRDWVWQHLCVNGCTKNKDEKRREVKEKERMKEEKEEEEEKQTQWTWKENGRVNWTCSGFPNRVHLTGLVVKACASRAKDPGFDSCLRRGDLSGSSPASDLKNGTQMVTLPGVWR